MLEAVGQNRTSLWIEQDTGGQLWVFLSFETLDNLPEDLRLLAFYTAQSFVHASDGSVSLSGVWPDGGDSVKVPFDRVN